MDTCNLFEEDEVYIYNPGKGYTFGLVLENYEFVSSDEDEDEEDEEKLQKGTVRVAWHPTGKEAVMAENKIHLADRSLMPGDVVRRPILGQDSQCGYVTNMEVKASLRVLRSNKFIYNVNSSDLAPIVPYENGQEVLLDAWWGRVDNVIIEVVLLFPDGAKCKVDESDLVMFDDITEKQRDGEFSMGPYYPGQELKGPMSCLGTAKWIHSTSRFSNKVANKIGKTSTVSIAVDKIELKSVEVQWIFGPEHTSPPRIVTGEDLTRLKVLDWFSHCSLQIGDRMLYHVKNDDVVVTTPPNQTFVPENAMDPNLGIVVYPENGPGSNNGDTTTEAAGESQETATGGQIATNEEDDADFEDVEDDDDDGSESGGDGKPGPQGGRAAGHKSNRKKGKSSYKGRLKSKQSQKSAAKKREVKAIERPVRPDTTVEVETVLTTSWATVMWQDGTLETGIPSVDLFPVQHLDEHEFFPGDFVLHKKEPTQENADTGHYGVVRKADHAERTCTVHWFKVFEEGKEVKPTSVEENCEMSVYDIEDHTHFKFRPAQSVAPLGGSDGISSSQAVGQIYELDGNGHLVIKWADGTISQRYPQEVFIISMEDENDSDDGWDDSDDDSDTGSDASSVESWETESEEEVEEGPEPEPEEKEEANVSELDLDTISKHRKQLDSLLDRAQAALVRLQQLLNTFDVTVQAPDCYHDILRIFRSCSDLDRILKSSFFRDSELRALVGQVKQELKREKANKFTKHLCQVFESWSQNMPALSTSSPRSFGLVGTEGQLIKFSAKKSSSGQTVKISTGKGSSSQVEVSIQIAPAREEAARGTGDQVEGESVCGVGETVEEGATGGVDLQECQGGLSQGTSSDSIGFEAFGLKKEFSEPAISKCLRDQDVLAERRPSDSVVNGLCCLPPMRGNSEEANLVGENCVAKASKRVNSDEFDHSGSDAKKCKEDKKQSSQVAQDLCLKVCQSLQKRILLIHTEMKKRTLKILQVTNDPTTEKGKVKEKVQAKDECDDSSQGVSELSNSEGGEVEAVKPTENEAKDAIGESDSKISKPVDDMEEDSSLSDWAHLKVPSKGFEMLEEAPDCHNYHGQAHVMTNPRTFRAAVRKELSLFQSSLPDGIFVKGFEDRLDLFSVMILGPEGTPYEDALFLFDIVLPKDYPSSPPVCYYHSYCSGRLNPNLYEDGKVCVSLLGTWSGKGTEVWTPKSNLLQVLVSVQGLILVPEPYYNEAGFERQRGTQVGQENSRMYNEMAILKTVQCLTSMCERLPTVFAAEVKAYLLAHGNRMISRLRHWVEQSQPVCQEADSGIAGSPFQANGAPLQFDALSNSDRTVSDQKCNPPTSTDNTTEPFSAGSDKSTPSGKNSIREQSFAHPPSVINCDSDQSLVCPNPQAASGDESAALINGIQGSETVPNKVTLVSSQLEHLSLVPNGQVSKPLDISCDGKNATGNEKPVKCEDNNILEKIAPIVCQGVTAYSKDHSSECAGSIQHQIGKPEFPLFPMSKGFRLTLKKILNQYETALQKLV